MKLNLSAIFITVLCLSSTPTVKANDKDGWSPAQKESTHKYICPSDEALDFQQVLVGRSHFGDENKSTYYRCAKLILHKEEQAPQLAHYDRDDIITSGPIKESDHYNGYTCPANHLMVGQEHSGDENGTTTYYCARFYVDNPNGTFSWIIWKNTDDTDHQYKTAWSQALKESIHEFTCFNETPAHDEAPHDSAIIGRAHYGDENGQTWYKCTYPRIQ